MKTPIHEATYRDPNFELAVDTIAEGLERSFRVDPPEIELPILPMHTLRLLAALEVGFAEAVRAYREQLRSAYD